jgi:DNA-directed RNA polymerase specialized sigma24 family protein
LPEKSRPIHALRYEARKSIAEFARVTGQSFDAVTKSPYRLRQAIADCVERKLSQTD